MSDSKPHVLVNRDAPIPVLNSDSNNASSPDQSQITEASSSKTLRVKTVISKAAGKIKDKTHARSKQDESQINDENDGDDRDDGNDGNDDHVSAISNDSIGNGESKQDHGHSLQDRLFAKILSQVLPPEDVAQIQNDAASPKSSAGLLDRPGFSISLMTTNFRRFNARVGIMFVIHNQIERLFTWRKTSHTCCLLAACTLICLDPYLLAAVPFMATVILILVPAYLARHPAPPATTFSSSDPCRNMYRIDGPAIAPPPTLKPAPEVSRDFFRNMRDVQNFMADFSILHDQINDSVTTPVNFSNESTSSTIFLLLCLLTSTCFLFAHLVPWRAVSLIACWSIICVGHPQVQAALLRNWKSASMPGHAATRSEQKVRDWLARDIRLDAKSECRGVEVFEIHHKTRTDGNAEWQPLLFSPTPYEAMSVPRLNGRQPIGCRSLDEVQAPEGWAWIDDDQWRLDLHSSTWVEDRMLQDVHVELDAERWVTDLVGDASDAPRIDERDDPSMSGIDLGLWRRRRWIRNVCRQSVDASVNARRR